MPQVFEAFFNVRQPRLDQTLNTTARRRIAIFICEE